MAAASAAAAASTPAAAPAAEAANDSAPQPAAAGKFAKVRGLVGRRKLFLIVAVGLIAVATVVMLSVGTFLFVRSERNR